MKRIAWHGALAALAVVMLGRVACGQTYELKVTHFLPPNHTFQKAMLAWSDELDKASHGRLKFRIFPASQLGPINRQFDLVRGGVADIAVGLHGATPGRFPITDLVALPYTAPKAGANSEITSKRLTELYPAYLTGEHDGLRVLWLAVTPPLLIFSRPPLRKLDDFAGVRIRYAGVQFKNIIEALGAVPVPVPAPEGTDAMAKGIIDGSALPYEGAASFDLGTVAKYALEPGISSNTFAIAMNPATYDTLPAELRALIDKTSGPARAEWYGRMWDEAEKAGKDSLQAKGVQTIVLPEGELLKAKKAMSPLIETAIGALEKQGKPARKFYDAYRN